MATKATPLVLKNMPSHKHEKSFTMAQMSGGLNIRDIPSRIGDDDTPDALNILWKNGALHSRDAQAYMCRESKGIGYATYEGEYYDNRIFHIGNHLYYTDGTMTEVTESLSAPKDYGTTDGFAFFTKTDGCTVEGTVVTPTGTQTVKYMKLTLNTVKLKSDTTEAYNLLTHSGVETLTSGSFFRYHDSLFYKGEGYFVRIAYNGSIFVADNMESDAYIPTTIINAKPENGAGDMYQPENRLQSKKKMFYTQSETNNRQFWLPVIDADIVSFRAVYGQKGSFQNIVSNKILEVDHDFTTWDSSWNSYRLVYYRGDDGTTLAQADTTCHMILHPGFPAPYYFNNMRNDTIEIVYSKVNTEAHDAIMSCKLGIAYDMCIVLAGGTGQENAFFWNGNSNLAMDETYWPIDFYNLAGDNYEKITALGIQQKYLMLFKEHSVWRTQLGTQTVDNRELITFDVSGVNSKHGCDVPGSLQLVDNNLVFANTEDGLCILLNTSAAYENNIESLSGKINGGGYVRGFLYGVRHANYVASIDDGKRYWITMSEDGLEWIGYVWDHGLSTYKDPSLFKIDGVEAISFSEDAPYLIHLNGSGQITLMGDLRTTDDASFHKFAYTDYGEAILKHYKTPTVYGGTYDNLKDFTRMVVSTPFETESHTHIVYQSDNNVWEDNTPLIRLIGDRETTFTRKPMVRHSTWFNVKFYNNRAGEDLALATLTIFYNIQGRGR